MYICIHGVDGGDEGDQVRLLETRLHSLHAYIKRYAHASLVEGSTSQGDSHV